jgi:hypothetical protein
MASRRLWVPLLVALLVAALIGPGVMTGAEPRATVTRALMIPAAAAIPGWSDMDYSNNGGTLTLGSGIGTFSIPLSFAVPVVTLKRITLYAYDNGPGSQASANLWRTYPPEAAQAWLGTAATIDGADDPQTVTTTTISPRTVNTANYGLFLAVHLSGTAKFYGVKILYSYEV